jgi:Cdc6-like AAA superfamily ATPase
MGFFAPRFSMRLLDEIDRLAGTSRRAADICREIGEYAEEQGFRRPSYQQVRLHVRRAQRRPRRVSTGEVLLDVALRVEHPQAFLQHVSGTQTRFKNK